MKITTNNVPRAIIDSSELVHAERQEFDYLDWNAIEEGNESASFFRYKGQLYDLGNFMALRKGEGSELDDWHGASADGFFSGTVVRYVEDGEAVIVGWYCE